MRVLIIGDFSSIHIYNFFSNVIRYMNCSCVGYHIVPDDIKPEYTQFYKDSNIQIVRGIDPSIYRKKGAFVFIKQSVELLNSLGKYDVVHVHAVRPFISLPIYFSRRNFKKIILTYWGSDLFRTTKLQLLATAPLLSCADIITVLTQDMLTYFKGLPWYINRNSKKVQVFDFGNMFFEKINSFIKNRDILKNEFNLDEAKLVCTIGYVGRPQMQQVKTVESILPLLIKRKSQVQLAIPAYGISDSDLEELNSLLKNSGVKYGIYTEFMNPDTVSKFRAITDIFIHAQTTDAISCAMIEHLFAGSIVINGEWLKYGILDENDISYEIFKNFDSLPKVLERAIDNIEELKDNQILNQSRIEKVWSWNSLRKFGLIFISKSSHIKLIIRYMYGFDIIQSNQLKSDIVSNGFVCRNNLIRKFENDKLFNENDKYIVILDGVITNKKEIETECPKDSWLNTIIHLYETKGEAFFSVLRGSFAGAIYVKNQDKWIIFGDQLGTKFVYYCKTDNFFCCSSVMGQMYNILNQLSIPYSLDETGVKLLLSYGFMLEDYTLCTEIRKLQPGEYITYEKGCLKVHTYYKLTHTKNEFISEEEAIETIDKLFRQAVKRQFDKDIEYGYDHIVALSAGLDCRMTSFVAHDLGYKNQTNITFSQSDYYDDYVSKNMATDLGHDWIFKSLDYGNWLLDVDEVNTTTGGNVLYYGTAHGNSLFKRLNFDKFGLLHSGQMGDVVFSIHSKSDSERYELGEGAYSKSFINQLSPFLRNQYPSKEIGLWYCRYLNGTNNGQQNEYNFTETLSPFLDLDLLEFALSIPAKIRYDHNLYKKWILNKYPQAASYIWTGLGDKISAPTIIFKGVTYSRKVFLKKLINRLLGKRSSYYNSKFNMNPVGFYMNQNQRLNDMLSSYHKYVDLIPNEDIKNNIKTIIASGKSIELIQVHTLMSALKLFFNAGSISKA